ncbi:MAG: DsrE family protein [Candidatus Riflebacteria bacterium]|nr:DsrE family protein [Candidatus Riflebacteria bacterium]
MKALIVLNDAPYGSERTYNGLRLAGTLARDMSAELSLFLIGDAVSCARRGQKVPGGYYNVETMLAAVTRRGQPVGVCGSCMDARALDENQLVEGVHRSSMEELTSWTVAADKVLIF